MKQAGFEPIIRRRRNGRMWMLLLILYVIVTTPLVFFLFRFSFLSFFNPFMFLFFSFDYLTFSLAIPSLLENSVYVMLACALLPLLGYFLVRVGFVYGKYAIYLPQVLLLTVNAIMLIYMGYTSIGLNIMLSYPYYFLLCPAGFVIPGLICATVKRWNPQKGKEQF